ncbi:MAG: 23S rRNA (guanosine(2251)-2'-O)-methyltransferase RlmB [Prolixibacteraceae bacterium]|jgi:23S rRNA (guanosine2251-2'-O)-methyltransferase|nr:23S rRNA (guanosine(2251)-2'-O)-methyltransferase RlmB [Prolixibacteraceae bacterium]MBT6005129.1 23S rRNA (guanosine(2251)-2'-O)-methyltransferase RlmB [Prolixibacteraceae bacterium]MBT6763763.1 23S rRNA (guanosine(2251)-2'-O)-methyltransferase RlmB [Prolixibacteraceae bacterium]MBT6999498.1 23S rRNA (guanosine(2251)-2'-O)-methyltransferase RlmB [Prolixibacteraceae bacterium]MBT7395888.1 23S rRNA (guanosine(2251)-2'-O)-methyltransferase RlmB [Prolixibacteraceae bacterium]
MNKDEYIFGTRAIIEAIKNGKIIEKVLIRKGLNNELFQDLFYLLKENEIAYQFVPIEKINRVTRKNHQGVLALLSPVEFYNIETLLPELYESGSDPFILILDQITDVRNFGAIVRSAECAGVQTIIIPDKGMARIGADAVKTSAGAIHNLPICRVDNLPNAIQFLKDSGIKIVAATEKADKLYTEANLNAPLGIVLGSEEKGISEHILKLADFQLKIPILGKIESLNVSVAAALMIYEAVRQKN